MTYLILQQYQETSSSIATTSLPNKSQTKKHIAKTHEIKWLSILEKRTKDLRRQITELAIRYALLKY